MNCVMILYWFNPFIYIVKNKALEDIEYVCDSRVVNGLEKKQIGIYCRTILDTVPVKGNNMISFNNSKMKIKKRIDNCFLENEKVSDKKLYALLGGRGQAPHPPSAHVGRVRRGAVRDGDDERLRGVRAVFERDRGRGGERGIHAQPL